MNTRFCKDVEMIENYGLAKAEDFKGWHIHHRLETHDEYGNKRKRNLSARFLKQRGLYYNRPAKELIFLPSKDHMRVHRAIKSEKYCYVLDYFEKYVEAYFPSISEYKRLEDIYKNDGIGGLIEVGDLCVDRIYFDKSITLERRTQYSFYLK